MSEWRPVLDPWRGRYADGFDPGERYEFRRGADGEPFGMRLADAGPLYNIAGLYWRNETGTTR